MPDAPLDKTVKLRLELAVQLIAGKGSSTSTDFDYREALSRADWMIRQIDNGRLTGSYAYQLFHKKDLMTSSEISEHLKGLGFKDINSKNSVEKFCEQVFVALDDYENISPTIQANNTSDKINLVVKKLVRLPEFNNKTYSPAELRSIADSLMNGLSTSGSSPLKASSPPKMQNISAPDIPETYTVTHEFKLYISPTRSKLENTKAQAPSKWFTELQEFKKRKGSTKMLYRPYQMFLAATVLNHLGIFQSDSLTAYVSADNLVTGEVDIHRYDPPMYHPSVFPEFIHFYGKV